MEGIIVVLLGAIFVIFLGWKVSDTREKRSMLNSIGLDFSESKIKKSIHSDKIKRAKTQIECAKNWVYKEKYTTKKAYWHAVREVLTDSHSLRNFDDLYRHFEFGDNDEIFQLCLEIIDNKISKL